MSVHFLRQVFMHDNKLQGFMLICPFHRKSLTRGTTALSVGVLLLLVGSSVIGTILLLNGARVSGESSCGSGRCGLQNDIYTTTLTTMTTSKSCQGELVPGTPICERSTFTYTTTYAVGEFEQASLLAFIAISFALSLLLVRKI